MYLEFWISQSYIQICLVIHVLKICKYSISDSNWKVCYLLQTASKTHNIHLFPEYPMSAAIIDSNFHLDVPVSIEILV